MKHEQRSLGENFEGGKQQMGIYRKDTKRVVTNSKRTNGVSSMKQKKKRSAQSLLPPCSCLCFGSSCLSAVKRILVCNNAKFFFFGGVFLA